MQPLTRDMLPERHRTVLETLYSPPDPAGPTFSLDAVVSSSMVLLRPWVILKSATCSPPLPTEHALDVLFRLLDLPLEAHHLERLATLSLVHLPAVLTGIIQHPAATFTVVVEAVATAYFVHRTSDFSLERQAILLARPAFHAALLASFSSDLMEYYTLCQHLESLPAQEAFICLVSDSPKAPRRDLALLAALV